MAYRRLSNPYLGAVSSPYRSDMYTVRQYGDNTAKIIWHKSLRDSGWESERPSKKKGSVNNGKLENNLCRAKSTVRELALCNDWDYWCTFTLAPDKHNRYDLESYKKNLGEFIHNYNRRCDSEYAVRYLLVPEKHQDGAWHMHGFIKGIRPKDLYTNQYCHLTWKSYEKKFGFISMDKIKDKERASSYILKYMTKDTAHSISELNAHLFYASKKLNRSEEIYRGSGVFKGSWDWEHEDGYCKIKNVDLRTETIDQYLDFVDDIPFTRAETDTPPRRKSAIPSPFQPWYDIETGEIYPTPFDNMEVPI